jgi:hypothetical protein
MTGRTDELYPESFGIVIRGQNTDHFNVAAITGSGVGMVDPQ